MHVIKKIIKRIKDITGICDLGEPTSTEIISDRHVAIIGIITVYIILPVIRGRFGSPAFITQAIHCIITEIPEKATITAAMIIALLSEKSSIYIPRVISIKPTLSAPAWFSGKKNIIRAASDGRPALMAMSAIIPKKMIYPHTYKQLITELEIL